MMSCNGMTELAALNLQDRVWRTFMIKFLSGRPVALAICFGLAVLFGNSIGGCTAYGQAGSGEPDPSEYAEDSDPLACMPSPSPTPDLPPIGFCNGGPDYAHYPTGCASGFIYSG